MTGKTDPQLLLLDVAGVPPETAKILFGLNIEQLAEAVTSLGEPGFRARQLAQALYLQRVTDLDEITTLPKDLRRRMNAAGWTVGRACVAQSFRSVDGTERYLFAVGHGDTVEAVWMPEGDGSEAGEDAEPNEEKSWNRATICLSSQVGCAMGCQFCLTARLGLKRNLTSGEIAGQVIALCDSHEVEIGRDRLNLVFMGMGEPLANYDNFMGGVRLLVAEAGLSPQRMTVSTSGIVPGIERLAAEPAEVRPKLALSLNAPDDALRGELMPVNRRWSIAEVLGAMRRVKLRPRERVTFEYVLLGGVTDRPEQARQVARLVRRSGMPVKVNLIAWNAGPGIGFQTPAVEAVESFRGILAGEGVAVFVRRPRGRDIFAACGQLKGMSE